MAKKKSTGKAAKRPLKNLSTRGRARKVTGGAIVISTRTAAPSHSTGAEGQPPEFRVR